MTLQAVVGGLKSAIKYTLVLRVVVFVLVYVLYKKKLNFATRDKQKVSLETQDHHQSI